MVAKVRKEMGWCSGDGEDRRSASVSSFTIQMNSVAAVLFT